MDALTLFGLLAVTAMLIFYALEDRSQWYILAFAAACALLVRSWHSRTRAFASSSVADLTLPPGKAVAAYAARDTPPSGTVVS